MRTIVNTTKRTTYVVTDHDIIEALASLGIPRSVLFSGDTAIKVEGDCVRDEEGFFFVAGDDNTFLTVEAPAEESESPAPVTPTPAPAPDVYPNGTVLIGQYTGVEYTILGYDRVTDRYTVRMDGERKTFQSPRGETHDGRIYRVKPAPAPAPAPAPEPDRFPVGTILRSKYGADYFIVGHVAPPEVFGEGYRLWCINDTRKDWEMYAYAHDPETYTVVHRPTPGALTPGEGAPADPFPVGTVLRYNLGSEFVSCVTGHAKDGDPDKGPGYTTSSVAHKTGWERYGEAHRNYTVLYRPPSKA